VLVPVTRGTVTVSDSLGAVRYNFSFLEVLVVSALFVILGWSEDDSLECGCYSN
jgi:hypothetical protein